MQKAVDELTGYLAIYKSNLLQYCDGSHADNMRDFRNRRTPTPLDDRIVKCIATLREIMELGRQGIAPESICRRYFAFKRTGS